MEEERIKELYDRTIAWAEKRRKIKMEKVNESHDNR